MCLPVVRPFPAFDLSLSRLLGDLERRFVRPAAGLNRRLSGLRINGARSLLLRGLRPAAPRARKQEVGEPLPELSDESGGQRYEDPFQDVIPVYVLTSPAEFFTKPTARCPGTVAFPFIPL